MLKLGFIGTGLLGYPMAESLLEAGYHLNIYNRTRSKAEPLAEKGGVIFDSPEEVVENSEAIITMLTTFDANLNVLKPEKNDFTGKTVIQSGTIKVEENIELKKLIEEKNGEYAEAPVLGSIPNVKNKTLITLFGGTKEQFEKFKPVFEVFGKNVEYFGEVGKASAAKLAFNQLIATLTAAFSMSLGFVIESGVNVEKFMEVLRKSSLYAPSFDKKLPRMLKRDFSNPNFPVKNLLKDVNLIYEDFAEKHIDTEILDALKYILRDALRIGEADSDYSAIYNAIHKK